MSSIYILKKSCWIPWGYEQYPQDNLTIFKYMFQMAHDNEQIMICREESNLYYAYVLKLANGERVGVGLVSNKISNDYYNLLKTFRSILKQLSDEELVIVKNSKLELVLSKKSFKEKHVNLDIFIRTHKLSINGESIPVAEIDVPKDDVVRCELGKKSSAWIVEQIKAGYHKVFITVEPSSPKPFNFHKLGKVLGAVLVIPLLIYGFSSTLRYCSNSDTNKGVTVKVEDNKVEAITSSRIIAPVVAEPIKEKEITAVPEPVAKQLTQKERFDNAKRRKDWNSIKQLADEGYSPAYLPLAKHYMNNSRQHGLAKKYAEKAKRAGIAGATEILNELEDLDY